MKLNIRNVLEQTNQNYKYNAIQGQDKTENNQMAENGKQIFEKYPTHTKFN